MLKHNRAQSNSFVLPYHPLYNKSKHRRLLQSNIARSCHLIDPPEHSACNSSLASILLVQNVHLRLLILVYSRWTEPYICTLGVINYLYFHSLQGELH